MSDRLELLRGLLDMLLRVPPLFFMDCMLKSKYSVTIDLTKCCVYVVHIVSNFFRKNGIKNAELIDEEFSFLYVSFGFLHLLGFCVALLSFLLTTRQLLSVYLSVASGGVIVWSYVMNVEYMKYCTDLIAEGSNLQHEMFLMNKTAVKMFFGSYFSQTFWAIIFCFSSMSLPNFRPKKIVAGISFIFPTLISIMPLPVYVLSIVPLLTTLIAFSFLICYLLKHSRVLFYAIWSTVIYLQVLIDHYGIIHFVIHQWRQLHIFQVLRVFWLTRTAKQAVVLFHEATFLEYNENGFFIFTQESLMFVAQELLIQSCDTFLAVLGMTCTLTAIIEQAVTNVQSFLLIPTNARRNVAPVISVIFLTLAMQTGLTALEPEFRLVRVYRNIVLMFSAVSHSVHESIHTVLVSLSVSANPSLSKHIRALAGGVLLIAYSSCILTFLWTKHVHSAWLLAASAFSVEVIIKVVLSFVVYLLNMIDTRCSIMWEKFDDYMFCVISTGHIISFLFGIFLFVNACYILIYESIGVTRIAMMIIHLYFNIWSQMEAGWYVFSRRISAANKVEILPEATAAQLLLFDDVCSICHQPLNSARITSCNHYFHGVCLKKWLYEQNSCPFCHKYIFNTTVEHVGRVILLPGHEHQE